MVKENFKKKDGDNQEKKARRRKAFQLIKTAYISDPQTSGHGTLVQYIQSTDGAKQKLIKLYPFQFSFNPSNSSNEKVFISS